MLDNVLRDEATMPILTELLVRLREYMGAVHEILMAGRPSRGPARRRISAAIAHALAFTTWRTLTQQLTNQKPPNSWFASLLQMELTYADSRPPRRLPNRSTAVSSQRRPLASGNILNAAQASKRRADLCRTPQAGVS